MTNVIRKKSKREPTWEEVDEALDLMAFGGLDPTPPKYYLDLPAILEYAKKRNKDLSELTLEEIKPFWIPN